MTMLIRRAMLEKVYDNSPKIAEYGYSLGRSATGVSEHSSWCYTEWYNVEPYTLGKGESTIVVDANASFNNTRTYQYEFTDGVKDYWYGSSDFSEYKRSVSPKILKKIRCSIRIDHLDDCYMYIQNSGQIIFAGKNSIYYGHRNISELN